jgi:DNA repair photolyase
MNMKKKATGTREWAAHNINIQRGCEHGCLYCYAHADAKRFKRVSDETSDACWTAPVINRPFITSKMKQNLEGTIMFPTTHDITPLNIQECVLALETMLCAGNKVLIVTKSHLSCVKTICSSELLKCEPYKSRVLWRFTIGAQCDDVLKFWEPHATFFQERLQCLAYAWAHGYKTSVSCEPLLTSSVPETRDMVETLRPFVNDAIWLGRANHLQSRLSLNCPGNDIVKQAGKTLEGIWDNERVRDLYSTFRDDPIIKWKNSVKEIVGLTLNPRDGMDE